MPRDGTLVYSTRQVFLYLAGSCAGGIGIIALLARDRGVAFAAAASFAAATALSVAIARLGPGRSRARMLARIAGVGLLGASAALPGWFFGPSSAYAGILALILLFAGLMLGGTGALFPTSSAWAVLVGICGGQGAIAILVFTGAIRDASLLPLVPPGATVWHHVAAHLTVQLVYVAAFGIGRVLHRRYWTLSEQLDATARTIAERDALLDEARAEYRRTFALRSEGVFAGHTIGRYRLGELIGRGGAGEVYAATDTVDGSRAAVKVLRADRLADATDVRGFLEEATALTQVDNPHVVRTHHVGRLDEILPYIAMEHLEGATLDQLLAERGVLDRATLRALVADAGDALEAVHRAGVVHGDVHPGNLVSVDGAWKLIDFGARDRPAGRPRFTAPERRAGPATASTDLHGMAACIYFAATGREPFTDATAPMPPDPRLHGEVSDGLARALAIGLAPDPAARHATAAAQRAALLAALDGEPLDDADHVVPDWSDAPTTDLDDATEPGAPSPTAIAATIASASRNASSSARRSDAGAGVAAGPARRPTSSADADVAPSSAGANPSTSASPKSGGATEPFTWTGAPTSLDTVATLAWHGAFADKMRLQSAAVLAACMLGAVLLALIVDDRALLVVGLATIAASAIAIVLERRFDRGWPWLIVAALAIGPAYVLGLHSGFAAVLAVTLFVESSFRSSRENVTGRGWLVAIVVATHAAAFALIRAGALPDTGVTTVLHHEPAWSGVVIQLLALGIYITAFVVGRATSARYADLVTRNEVAAHAEAQQQAVLATARAEVDRVLAGFTGGLFTGSRIGSYEIGRLLGRGGMGEVYAARGPGAGRRGPDVAGPQTSTDVALKVIRADRAGGSNLRRFAREAEALMRVASPYVARVLDSGTEDGRLPYLVMELAQGISLAELLRTRDRLTPEETLAFARDATRGLADVHRAQVVHRDVKPHNFVRTAAGGHWKLVDFGIAKIDDGARLTGDLIVGTPAYMGPEQLSGGPADARSDLYSLCLVLYRAIAGRPAFTASRIAERTSHPPDPYALVVEGIPLDVCHVIRIGLATVPSDRFASAGELEAALAAAFAGRLDDGLRERATALRLREPWS